MTCLRHEEFKEGCDAACNGPYDGECTHTQKVTIPREANSVESLFCSLLTVNVSRQQLTTKALLEAVFQGNVWISDKQKLVPLPAVPDLYNRPCMRDKLLNSAVGASPHRSVMCLQPCDAFFSRFVISQL